MSKLVHTLFVLFKELPQMILFIGLAMITGWLSDWFPKYVGHPEFTPLFTTIYMLVLLIFVSHLALRILFHKLDLQALAKQAAATPAGAGMVVAALCFVLAMIILCFTLMLH